ncbi:hypothetical protein D3C86_1525020 [compost metagenome]
MHHRPRHAIADEQVGAGAALQHPGEVFAAHEFGGVAVHCVGAHQLDTHLAGELGFGGVVDQYRISRAMFDCRTATKTLSLRFDDRTHAVEGLLTHLGVQRAQAQAQDCLLWNDVGCFPGLQCADRHHSGLLRIDVARDHRLQRHHHARRRHQRIDRQMWHRTVAANTFNGDGEQILRGHHRPYSKT